jgi:hypothetical protein
VVGEILRRLEGLPSRDGREQSALS